jgi:hypothetical protein
LFLVICSTYKSSCRALVGDTTILRCHGAAETARSAEAPWTDHGWKGEWKKRGDDASGFGDARGRAEDPGVEGGMGEQEYYSTRKR